jgi:hypothetical protein
VSPSYNLTWHTLHPTWHLKSNVPIQSSMRIFQPAVSDYRRVVHPDLRRPRQPATPGCARVATSSAARRLRCHRAARRPEMPGAWSKMTCRVESHHT